MTFEEILDQAVAILQRRGRVSYRALQRQVQLDDAYLQDLTTEIVEVLQLAVDHDHTMLVWTGGPSAPAPVSPSLSRTLPPDPQALHPTPRAPAPSVQQAPEAERRQLTVMFCDLVGSTVLSTQLDPEELREVIQTYRETCASVLRRFGGYLAKYIGDGLMVYFGYPQAHEDDAQHAVWAGLGIIENLPQLNTRLRSTLEAHRCAPLQVRLGIHTGLVVAREMGVGDQPEPLAIVGETPNIAARLQGLAEPDTVVMSAATHRLVQGFFACRDLGVHPVKGIPAPVPVYLVLGKSEAQSRFEVAVRSGLTPLVGRDEEVG